MCSIVYIDPEPPTVSGGGIRSYIREMAKFCETQNIDVIIFTHSPKAYPKSKTVKIDRSPVKNFFIRKILYKFLYTFNVVLEQSKWISQQLEKPEYSNHIAEFCDFMGYGYYSVKNKRSKLILRVHTPLYVINPENNNSLSNWFLYQIEKYSLKNFKQVTAPSKSFVEEKMSWLKNYLYIPNLIPDLYLKKPPTGKSASNCFLYIGRIEPRKGVIYLIRAFLELAQTEFEIELKLIGSAGKDNYNQQILALVKESPLQIQKRIQFLGEMDHNKVIDYLYQDSICVFPSLWENAPYSFFESILMGKYCIVSRTGEMKKIAEDLNLPMVKPGNVSDLKSVIFDCIKKNSVEINIKKNVKYLSEMNLKTKNECKRLYNDLHLIK